MSEDAKFATVIKKKRLLASIHFNVLDLMNYGRRDDKNLTITDVEDLIVTGEISTDEMVAMFRVELESYILSRAEITTRLPKDVLSNLVKQRSRK